MAKYRKKPVVIEAIQLTENNIKEVEEFIEGKEIKFKNDIDMHKFSEYKKLVEEKGIKIKTLEGEITGLIGDYIIKGVEGEFYPCKPGIFHKTYEKVK